MRNEIIIKKIYELCDSQQISDADLLSKASLSTHLIRDWAANKSVPSLPALKSICEVLNVDISYLFKTEEDSFTQSQRKILNEWRQLSVEEKEAINLYISALKSINK